MLGSPASAAILPLSLLRLREGAPLRQPLPLSMPPSRGRELHPKSASECGQAAGEEPLKGDTLYHNRQSEEQREYPPSGGD